MEVKTYSALMQSESVHLILNISTEEPIELSSFVGVFASLETEFERFISETNPDLKADAKIYVQEIRKGSIEADMFPVITALAGVITQMDQMLIVEQFVKKWGQRLGDLIANKKDAPNTQSELQSWANATEAIANDPNGTANLEAAFFEDGDRKIKAAFKFNTSDAKKAQKHIASKRKLLQSSSNADHERVMMVFTRSDRRYSGVGKRSGELVQIERVFKRPLPLMYGSRLAEERIKHEVREADDNIFKKGFSVDVNVEYRNEKPKAYSITAVHEVFDLPEDED